MTTYIILSNANKTEMALCEKDSENCHGFDVDGIKMHVKKEFDAENWDAATIVYENFLNEW